MSTHYNPCEDVTSEVGSLRSDDYSSLHANKSSVNDNTKVDSDEINPIGPQRSSLSLNRVKSVTSSLSRINSIKRTMSRNVTSIYNQVKDDNLQTEQDELERKRTRLGRELADLGIEDAIRISTIKSTTAAVSQTNSKAEDAEQLTTGDQYPPMDTGYAWMIVFAGFIALFATWGINGSYGVFLSYWLNHDTFKGAEAIDYAFIGGMVLCLAQALSPLVLLIAAVFGLKFTGILGTFVYFAGFLLCSFATKLWQLYLTQGVLVGVGFAFVLNPIIIVVPEWFDKKRGFAMGIIACASGGAGVVFSLSVQKLIDDTGSYQWSIRMLAIIALVLNIIALILTKPRIPRKRLMTWVRMSLPSSMVFKPSVVFVSGYQQIKLVVST
ncbi:unnamed protein product [Ambrosiozyma monospora]|uniref:Unnamed protein product n=1 Tax=Ambrosiozyma monospora TaxID=43982 RepID=A0ACB5T6Q8_AMBMO|nr:unnamed protein product [Ambrosiozyma monospora]